MSDTQSKSGFRFLSKILILVLLAGLVYYAFQTVKPQSLSDIEGYGAKDRSPNLVKRLERAVETEAFITITEAELNAYFRERLTLKQFKLAEHGIKPTGLYVRLEDGEAELILEREIRGYPHTASMFFRVRTVNDDFGRAVLSFDRTGARLGNLRLPPAYVLLIQDAFIQVREALDAELTLAFGQMHRITMREGQIDLDGAPVTLSMEELERL